MHPYESLTCGPARHPVDWPARLPSWYFVVSEIFLEEILIIAARATKVRQSHNLQSTAHFIHTLLINTWYQVVACHQKRGCRFTKKAYPYIQFFTNFMFVRKKRGSSPWRVTAKCKQTSADSMLLSPPTIRLGARQKMQRTKTQKHKKHPEKAFHSCIKGSHIQHPWTYIRKNFRGLSKNPTFALGDRRTPSPSACQRNQGNHF